MHGHDVLGNLIIGDRSLAAIMPTGRADSTRYDELAELSLSGETAGSSAGGEHPKFVSGNCIVKFSPLLDGSSVATRWSDLLVAEHCSTVVMSDHGILAPVTRIIQSDVRTHLESDRYDRAGTIGRLAVVSMGAIDDEFVGSRRSWATTANLMLKNKMLAEDVASKIDTIQQFGVLIGNSDMHFGNLSFFFEGLIRPELRLAPIYDMLPMRYAPEKGELVDRGDPVIESDNQLSIALPAAIEMAAAFWTSVANHALISDDFREVADRNLSRLNAAYGAQVMRV